MSMTEGRTTSQLRGWLAGIRNRWRAHRATRVQLLAWRKAGRPVPPPHVHKISVVRAYARRFGTPTLVETGTYRAQMILAAHDVFKVIHSIELSPELHAAAVESTAAYPNIHLWQGDSAVVLPLILATLQGACLFWLDAHYSGGETARGSVDTPIVAELQLIFASPTIKPIVLIDDARAFGTLADYPTLADIQALVNVARPGWPMTVLDDIIRIHPAPL